MEEYEVVLMKLKEAEREEESAALTKQNLITLKASWLKVALQHLEQMRSALDANAPLSWHSVSENAWQFLDYMKAEGMLQD